MKKIKIYGTSDDLIEIEGGIREEFNYCGNNKVYLFFDDNKQVSCIYNEVGIWQFECLNFQPEKHDKDVDGDEKYSEIIEFSSDAKKVRLFKNLPNPENKAIFEATWEIIDIFSDIIEDLKENIDNYTIEKDLQKILKKYIK